MAGSFSSINTALTALRYQQIALDVAGTNVANVGTDGYVRRRVVGETLGAGHVPALWSRSGTPGGNGVQASRLDRMVDPLLDARVRREHGRQTYLDAKAEALARVETGLAEPGDSGVAAALADFRASLHDLGSAPGSDAARSQVLAAAATVTDAIRLQAHHLSDEASDQRAHALSAVDEINAIATQLATTNQTISAAKLGSTDTTSLLDERDALALRLAELTGATATINAQGGMDVVLAGQSPPVALVAGSTAARLTITGGIAPDGTATAGPVAFTVNPDTTGGSTVLTAPLGGDLGATAQLLDTDLPAYVKGLAAVVTTLVTQVNAAHRAGYDAAGNLGGDFFTLDTTAGLSDLQRLDSLGVAVTASTIAVSAVAAPSKDGSRAEILSAAANVNDPYQRLVNGFGSTVASAQRLAKNQSAMTAQVDSAREQLTGVSLDEESINMVAAQRAYEAASRVMTTVDSVLDTLINRTGLVR
jgi:flagellar hook-associated protein 1 FlgK